MKYTTVFKIIALMFIITFIVLLTSCKQSELVFTTTDGWNIHEVKIDTLGLDTATKFVHIKSFQ